MQGFAALGPSAGNNEYRNGWPARQRCLTLQVMIDYGQFCTVARGAEIFGERWTPLVVRELLCGSTRFNDIRRGVPRMSATLLTQRLRKLEEVGVVKRVAAAGSPAATAEYHLTGAGEELRPIVMALGHWGARWIGSRLKRGQLDAGFLMWDMRRFVHFDEVPRGRSIVVHFRFSDARAGENRWWLVLQDGSASLCRDDPGQDLTLIVESTVLALTEVWTGDRAAEEALASRAIRVSGAQRDARALWRWLGRSAFAATRAAAR
jgi:DNA-binding HxlR family transcriptional regulator